MAALQALVAGDAAAFEQLCSMLMSSQNEQRSQVRGGRCTRAAQGRRRQAALLTAGGPVGGAGRHVAWAGGGALGEQRRNWGGIDCS